MEQTLEKNKPQLFLKYIFNRKFAHMTLLGFSAGLPLYLIFSSLSLWLDQVGIVKSSITMFSWAALGYSFKFLWSPLVDKLPIMYLTNKFGQRRGWLFLTQSMIIIAILWMAFTDPSMGDNSLKLMAFAVVMLGFSSATQDILIDAWRIEASDERDIAILSSLYIVGYRVGMITSGAGALFLAGYFGTSIENYNYLAWQYSYTIMAIFMLIGFITTIFIKEPVRNLSNDNYVAKDYLVILLIFFIAIASFIFIYYITGLYKESLKMVLLGIVNNSNLVGFVISFIQLVLSFTISILISSGVYKFPNINRNMIRSVYVAPVLDLFKRQKNNIWLLLAIIFTYRISDIVMGVSANLFYQHMGFDLNEIAGIVKTFGLVMTLTGGIVGGILVIKYGVLKIMIIGAFLSAVTNILFMIMAETGKSLEFLVVLISADNLSAGLAMAAFIGFLSMLVNKTFTAVQYAMFSSVMTLFPKILGGFSGGYIEIWGYSNFFLITALIGVPVIFLLIFAELKQRFKMIN